jgi:hypothetical protein
MSLPLLLALTLSAAPAAEAVDEAGVKEAPRNSVSLEVPGLFWNGIELVGERFVHPRVSVLLGLGGRFAGAGDYSAFTLSAGVGVRFWLNRFQLFSDLGGPVLGVRLDTGWTRITDNQQARSLETFSTALSLRLGYRFVILRRIEITPEAGIAMSMGFDKVPWLVAVPRPGAVLGLTVGYLF